MNTVFKISNLTGATDTGHIEKALEAVPRVNFVRVEPAESRATIDHEGADERELTAAIRQLGYDVAVE